MKKISIVIPAYNHEKFIQEAIESVLDCDYKDVEVIVIDDGSKDQTRKIVSRYKSVIYVYQENQGANAAINHGFSIASGEFLAILNDDDKYLREHLSNALDNLLTYGNDIFIGKPEIIGRGVKFEALQLHQEKGKQAIEELGLGKSLLEINWSVSTSAFVFRKHLYEVIGGFHNFTMCHDLDFLIRALLNHNAYVGLSGKPTWSYRCHETNSGSVIAIETQQAEIIYSLGRALDPIIDKDSIINLVKIIGYGINPKMKLLALSEKPWRNESRMGIEQSIRTWIESCSKVAF